MKVGDEETEIQEENSVEEGTETAEDGAEDGAEEEDVGLDCPCPLYCRSCPYSGLTSDRRVLGQPSSTCGNNTTLIAIPTETSFFLLLCNNVL